jgi:hypothetical protein
MSDNRDDADQTPVEVTYFYDYRVDAAEEGVAAKCTACRGTGKVALLVTMRPLRKMWRDGESRRHAGRAVR